LWTTLRVDTQPARADNKQKFKFDMKRRKKQNPPGAVQKDSNFARYAFKGFRFAPIPYGDGFAALERTRCVAMP
jgi:hypothetical protein